MFGRHLIKSWSRQQRAIALSSAEAETYDMVACSAELLGIQSCASDLGIQLSAAVYANASAALGIVQRRGMGKCDTSTDNVFGFERTPFYETTCVRKTNDDPSGLSTEHLTVYGYAHETNRRRGGIATGRNRARTIVARHLQVGPVWL